MKKKYLVLLLPLLFTGCFGNAGNGILKQTCTKEITTVNLIEEDKYIFEYVSGNITKMEIKKSYNMELDLEASMKAWNTFNGVHASISGNEITYEFDMNEVSDEVKEYFNIKDTYNEQVKTLTNLEFKCND